MVHAGEYSETLAHTAGSDGNFRVADNTPRKVRVRTALLLGFCSLKLLCFSWRF